MIEYRPADGRVSYARLAQDSNIGLVDVICTEPARGGTDVSVRYTPTPLDADGAVFVGRFLAADHFAEMIDDWRSATAAVLARGG